MGRQASDELAARLTAPRGRQADTVAAIDELSADQPSAQPAAYTAQIEGLIARALHGPPLPIGIWKPATDGGELRFERDPEALTKHWWPPHDILYPKQSLLPLRICLLGESTAAGWFHAPALTPAKVLANQLKSMRGGELFEVIDLCMVNLQPASLVELSATVQQLSPDVLVIFAGNNWAMRLPEFSDISLDDARAGANVTRTTGAIGLAEVASQRTAQHARRTMNGIAGVVGATGTPVLFVLPEANLADWRRDRPVAWLAGDGSRRWHALYREAATALAQEQYRDAANAARQMHVLDEGSCAASFQVAAMACTGLGDLQGAREASYRAIEARTWDNFPSVPSVTPTVCNVIRRAANEHEICLVDLPQVFNEYLDGALPGRSLFLDYCHLTPEGMHVSMAAVTESILSITGPPSVKTSTWPAIVEAVPILRPSPEAGASAQFISALYNANYGSEQDVYNGLNVNHSVARYWMEAGLASSKDVVVAMKAYIDSRGTPSEFSQLSVEQQRLQGALSDLEHQSAQSPGLNPEVVRLIAQVLEATGQGLRADWEARFVRNHAVGVAPQELVHPVRHWNMSQQHHNGAGYGVADCGFFRARWPISHFCIVSDGKELALDCVARLPAVDTGRDESLGVTLNGVPLAEVRLRDRWSKSVVRVPSTQLRHGFNQLSLHWPPLPDDGDAALRQIADRLEVVAPVDLHPVFGELHSLRARVAS